MEGDKSILSFIEASLSDTRPYVLPGNVKELVGKHITHSEQSTEIERKFFPGPYKIVLQKKRVRLPLYKRVRLRNINTGKTFALGLKKIRRIFMFIPEPNSEQIWQKTKQLIGMKTLMIAMLLAITVAANSQVNMPIGGPPAEKTLVGKSTWVVKSGESKFRIITAHDSMAYWMRSKFEFSNLKPRIVIDPKECIHGRYFERSFYFKNDDWDEVIGYIKPKLARL